MADRIELLEATVHRAGQCRTPARSLVGGLIYGTRANGGASTHPDELSTVCRSDVT